MITKDNLGRPLVRGQLYVVYMVVDGEYILGETVRWTGTCFKDQGGYLTDVGEETYGPEVACKVNEQPYKKVM